MAHYVTSLCCLLELPSPITRCPIPHHLLYPPCALHSTRHHLIQYLSVWLTICLFPLERKRHDNKGFVFLRLCPQCKQVSGIYKALSKCLLNGHLSPCNSLILSQPWWQKQDPAGGKKTKAYTKAQLHKILRHLGNSTDLPVPGAKSTNHEQRGRDEQKGLAGGGPERKLRHVMIHVKDFEFPHYLWKIFSRKKKITLFVYFFKKQGN